jgi:hypothetical protein
VRTFVLPLNSLVDGKPADQIDGDFGVANLLFDPWGQSIHVDGRRADRVIPFDCAAGIYQRVRRVELLLQILADSLLKILVQRRIPAGKTRTLQRRCVLDDRKSGNDRPLRVNAPEILLRRRSQVFVGGRRIQDCAK